MGSSNLVLDDNQIKAIKSLEKAFKKCEILGLKFVGVDTDLLCTTGYTNYDSIITDGVYVEVNTYDSYKDSFGS